MSDILAIDVMNHPAEARRGLGGNPFEFQEFQIMMRTTFKSALKTGAGAGKVERSKGVLGGHASPAELVTDMDRLGYDRIVITATKMWSYRYRHKLILDYTVDQVGEIVREAGGR